MKLQFLKNEGKPHVIRYYRDDGTQTWMQASEFFVRHDLSHFAVEKTLGYNTAFYGMINGGMALDDFLDKEKRDAIPLTNEAMHAESLANLFLMDLLQGKAENFDGMQRRVMATSFPQSVPVPIATGQTEKIRRLLSELLRQWKGLCAGNSLYLEIAV